MKKTRQIISLILIISLFAGFTLTSDAAKADNIGRLLDSYTYNPSAEFTLTKNSRVFIVSAIEPDSTICNAACLISEQLGTLSVFEDTAADIVYGTENLAQKGDIVLAFDNEAQTGDEGYTLDVGEKAVITAKDTRGFIYGAGTLIKIFKNNISVEGFTAQDTPDTKQRAVMLDTGRKYFTAEWIINFIRQISWMGYNTLELHFSEDGGFRADFWDENFYKDADGDGIAYNPQNDFSWLCGSHVQSWVKDPYRNDPDADKYLTTEELIEICEVAKKYSIDIIPSFDSPSHMDYITWKFEQNYIADPSYSFIYDGKTYNASSTDGCINYTGKTGASSPTWPYYTTIDITEGTMSEAFVFALYEDIADFFKEYAGSEDFSIGADEVNLSNSSVKWEYSAFPGYINKLNRLLNAKGYTCRIFNDFIGSATYNKNSASKAVYEFDSNIEIMYWASDFNINTGKRKNSVWSASFFWETADSGPEDTGDGGRTMYNCIGSNCYYVLRVAASTTSYPNMDARNPENRNWSFYGSTEEYIYNNWYPSDFGAKGRYKETGATVPEESLGGAYFLIWNDYAALNTEAEVWNGVYDNTGTSNYFYSLFDRMWSNSIKMWNSDINSTTDYATFAETRDTFGLFPGFTSCSEEASLPENSGIEMILPEQEPQIVSIEKISDITPYGKKAGLVIVTTLPVTEITITKDGETIEPAEIINEIQTRDEAPVRVWYINFIPDEKGTFEYTVSSADISETINITVA